jgi:pyruvate dehydrogenase E1 component beta subunit
MELDLSFHRDPLTFAEATNEGIHQYMELDNNTVVVGQLADSKAGIFGTTTGLDKDFPGRVWDFPIAEGLMHATGIGMALNGVRPILCHQRIDFMAPGLDPIINWLGLWYFKSGKEEGEVPVTIRSIVGRGWGQAPQHSKNLAPLLATIPGLLIYCPSNPRDAKGMMIDAINRQAPAIVVEHRSLFDNSQDVPEEMYTIQHCPRRLLGGHHLTVVTYGDMVCDCLTAFNADEYEGYIDLFDLRMINPLGGAGFQAIKESALMTGKLLVVEPACSEFGIAGEVLAQVMDGEEREIRFMRLGYPQGYTPMAQQNEFDFYPSAKTIKETADRMLDPDRW